MNIKTRRPFIAIQIAASLLLSSVVSGQETGSWKQGSSLLLDPKFDFTTAVVKGKIYIMGGRSGGFQVFDSITGSWVDPSPSGTFTDRDGLASAVVNDKIYVMGGYKDTTRKAVNKLEVYDPMKNSWSTPVTTGTFTGRGGLSAAVVDDKIYVMGGSPGDSSQISNTLEVFDPATNTWSTPVTTGTFTPRGYFAGSVVNGKIYTVGGTNSKGAALNTFEIFDPATNTWSTPATTGTFSARADLTSAVMNGKIYAIGGRNVHFLNTFEEFDPVTNVWSTPITTGKFTARSGLRASVLNGAIYTIGGLIEQFMRWPAIINANEVYTLTSPPKLGYIILADTQLNFGSHDYLKDSLLTVKVYNPSTSSISIDQTQIGGLNQTDFSVLYNTKQESLPYKLQPGDSIGFILQYTAPSATESDTAIFSIFFDGSTDSVRTIALSGSAIKPSSNGIATSGGTISLTALVFPNPAKSELRISYSIPKRSDIVLSVFDITGKEIAKITNESHDTGSFEKLWNVQTLANGSYILKLTACGESVTKVVEVVK